NREAQNQLKQNIAFFAQEINRLGLAKLFIPSDSDIHCAIVSGNDKVKNMALSLQQAGDNVKPILSPTLPQGQERLRFCLHSYTTHQEITKILTKLRELLHL